MELNLKERKSSQKKLPKFLSSAFFSLTIIYTIHNLFIADPNIIDVIFMKAGIRSIEIEIENMKTERKKLKEELKNLKEEIDILKKERGVFEDKELIIIYEKESP